MAAVGFLRDKTKNGGIGEICIQMGGSGGFIIKTSNALICIVNNTLRISGYLCGLYMTLRD